MTREYESNSSASGAHAEEAGESDGGSEEFTVLNVSKRAEVSASTRVDSANAEKKGANRLDEHDLESSARANNEVLGGSRLADWIMSVRKGVKHSDGRNQSFTKMIRKNKNFHNPAIFEKMISYCKIDEFGTRFTHRETLQQGEFYTDISEAQDMCMKSSA
ncbi:hypothetical protein BWQ96_02199 [Gracilariopsis chorda]|uniref:Uncharacterized protein n=1 Tax=Gracilariopsis chorda TaxID=448386 RepID=A0A2V3J0V1_9FLOR|nr:hypothetical protein BWQ96_02199 [Gracilariopsis chorda]|eukprot:PXF48008.1 hypothetical protein BWQ96_02199 [Gracilariopsis chorda]